MEKLKDFKAPSGRIFTPNDLGLMIDLDRIGFIRWREEPFTLKSGVPSHVYVFGRNDLTENSPVLMRVGQRILEQLRYHEGDERAGYDNSDFCLIGIPTAGTALALAASLSDVGSQWEGYSRSRLMREKKKSYGAHNTWVEGKPDHVRHRYVLVDNVATDGKSKEEAAEKLREDGYAVAEVDCLILVDRQQGAIKNLEKIGFRRIVVVYNLLDIAAAFYQLKLWPSVAVQKLESEIRAHEMIS